jgi:hypothetical protein
MESVPFFLFAFCSSASRGSVHLGIASLKLQWKTEGTSSVYKLMLIGPSKRANMHWAQPRCNAIDSFHGPPVEDCGDAGSSWSSGWTLLRLEMTGLAFA